MESFGGESRLLDFYSFFQTCGLLSFVFLLIRWNRKNTFQLPPGPSGLPLVGNILDFPRNGVPEYKHWLKHRNLYGDISSVTVLGQTIIILHDKEAAFDLMMRKAAKNSSRPNMEFSFKLSGFGDFTSSVGYNDTFRLHRKLMHKELGTTVAVSRFQDIQLEAVMDFLQGIADSPDKLLNHLKTESSAVILKLLYGYTVETKKPDPLVNLVNRMMYAFSRSTMPGVWMVDVIPALQDLPEWLPGTGFLQTARRWKKIALAGAGVPFDYVKQRISDQSHRPSYVANLLDQLGDKSDSNLESAIKWSAGTLYGGGGETTVSWLYIFFLAMLKFPEVQRKAREEIFRVVGKDRLPNFGDREKLQYLDAVIKETHRWHPVTPFGLPHSTDEADFYKGYVIPKDAILMPATWWYAHDPKVYNRPESYDPDRFLGPASEPDPREFIFGIGRRVCPGRLLAESTIFLTVAQVLSVFNIQKATDRHGNEIDPELDGCEGIISRPKDYPFKITPISDDHLTLLKDPNVNDSGGEKDSEYLERNGLIPELEDDETLAAVSH